MARASLLQGSQPCRCCGWNASRTSRCGGSGEEWCDDAIEPIARLFGRFHRQLSLASFRPERWERAGNRGSRACASFHEHFRPSITMLSREALEQHQVRVYGVTLLAGAAAGLVSPASVNLQILIEPVIGILLYGMFSQVPFLELGAAVRQHRFLGALTVANFVLIPVLVWILTRFLPSEEPALLLGVLLVLLTPCIDYVIVFTHLGRGNAKLTLAATPLLFVVQVLLLPVYLWLFLRGPAAAVVQVEPFLRAFLVLIVLPLAAAVGAQLWARRRGTGAVALGAAAWLPVPMMALTLFVVVASQIGTVVAHVGLIARAVPIYVAFLAAAPFAGRLSARLFGLETEAGRAVAFSATIRNSLVVLPLGLALPAPAGALVAAVIVTQTLVELAGVLVLVRAVPWMMPDRPLAAGTMR